MRTTVFTRFLKALLSAGAFLIVAAGVGVAQTAEIPPIKLVCVEATFSGAVARVWVDQRSLPGRTSFTQSELDSLLKKPSVASRRRELKLEQPPKWAVLDETHLMTYTNTYFDDLAPKSFETVKLGFRMSVFGEGASGGPSPVSISLYWKQPSGTVPYKTTTRTPTNESTSVIHQPIFSGGQISIDLLLKRGVWMSAGGTVVRETTGTNALSGLDICHTFFFSLE